MSALADLLADAASCLGDELSVLYVLGDRSAVGVKVGRDHSGQVFLGEDPTEERVARIALVRAARTGAIALLHTTAEDGDQLRGWLIIDGQLEAVPPEDLAALLVISDV